MTRLRNPHTTGVVLCGGQSRRMHPQNKALLPFGHTTLLDRVVDRLGVQVSHVVLSCGRDSKPYVDRGIPLVTDTIVDYGGPLIGVYSALRAMIQQYDTDWLACVPCDAPFVPLTLIDCLHRTALARHSQIVITEYAEHLQPTFSLWHRDLIAPLEAAISQQQHGFMEFLDTTAFERLPWPEATPPPFFNVNTLDEYQQAQAWLCAEVSS